MTKLVIIYLCHFVNNSLQEKNIMPILGNIVKSTVKNGGHIAVNIIKSGAKNMGTLMKLIHINEILKNKKLVAFYDMPSLIERFLSNHAKYVVRNVFKHIMKIIWNHSMYGGSVLFIMRRLKDELQNFDNLQRALFTQPLAIGYGLATRKLWIVEHGKGGLTSTF